MLKYDVMRSLHQWAGLLDGFSAGYWWFNARDWMGRVVVPRVLGARSGDLITRFPSHTTHRVTWRPWVSTPD